MSRRPLLLLAALVCVCSSMLLGAAEAKTHHHTWDISYQYKSLDCFEKLAVTVNGESPGPTIHAARGDTVVVTVRNKLETENTAIHWHGIRQIGTPWADGVSGVTQCPILPGETFTYRFVVDRVRNQSSSSITSDQPSLQIATFLCNALYLNSECVCSRDYM